MAYDPSNYVAQHQTLNQTVSNTLPQQSQIQLSQQDIAQLQSRFLKAKETNIALKKAVTQRVMLNVISPVSTQEYNKVQRANAMYGQEGSETTAFMTNPLSLGENPAAPQLPSARFFNSSLPVNNEQNQELKLPTTSVSANSTRPTISQATSQRVPIVQPPQSSVYSIDEVLSAVNAALDVASPSATPLAASVAAPPPLATAADAGGPRAEVTSQPVSITRSASSDSSLAVIKPPSASCISSGHAVLARDADELGIQSSTGSSSTTATGTSALRKSSSLEPLDTESTRSLHPGKSGFSAISPITNQKMIASKRSLVKRKQNQGRYYSDLDRKKDKEIQDQIMKAKLSSLTNEMNKLFTENLNILNEPIDADEVERSSGAVKSSNLDKHRNIRSRIAGLLDGSINKNKVRIPLWRHLMQGTTNPDEKAILKPIDIWRAVGWTLCGLVVGPTLAISKRREASRTSELEQHCATLQLFHEPCAVWLGKLVKVAVASVQDPTLDFNVLAFDSMKRQLPRVARRALEKRVLQIKVRATSIVRCLLGNESTAGGPAEPAMPPSHIVQFLGSLADDGLYYSDDYFYPTERAALQFDRFGATSGMLPEVVEPYADDIDDKSRVRIHDKTFDVSRFRVMLKNYLLVRVLVVHVVLSPWRFGVCAPPSLKDKSLFNYRMLASVLYEIIQRGDPFLPSLDEAFHVSIRRHPSNEFTVDTKRQEGVNSGETASKRKMRSMDVSVMQDAMQTAAKNVDLQPTYTETSNSTSNNTVIPNTSMSTLFSPSAFFAWLAEQLEDKILTSSESQLEAQLTRARPVFGTFESFRRFLISTENSFHARPLMEPWIAQLSLEVNRWVDAVVVHTIQVRTNKKAPAVQKNVR